MATLRELAGDLGAPVLEVVAAPAGLDVELSGRLVLHDPGDPMAVGSGDLAVVVGALPGAETARLFHELARHGAAAVLAKTSPSGVQLSEYAEAAGLGLLAVQPGASWTQVMQLISSVLSRGSFGVPGEALAGVQAGDLFAVANVVADLVDAPITIEDPASRIIAFSSRQEEADASRAATILGQGVPQEYLDRLRELGVFKRLATEREPIFIDNVAPGVMPRVAVAIRAENQVLGSIWAAVRGPLAPERERALIEAASYVALHLLRHRLALDAEQTLESELVNAVLKGGNLAGDAAHRLNLRGAAFRVVGFSVDAASPDGTEHARARLKNLAALNLSSPDSRAVIGLSGGVVYAIVPVQESENAPRSGLRSVVETFVARSSALLGATLMAGLGTRAVGISAIPESRVAADEVLRVLRAGRSDLVVAELGDVRAQVLLMRFADACGDGATMAVSPLGALREHDALKHTAHVATCRAYLDAFGDVEAAAQALSVHPNTVRYRLRQIEELTGVRLRDPSERLALELELRLANDDVKT